MAGKQYGITEPLPGQGEVNGHDVNPVAHHKSHITAILS